MKKPPSIKEIYKGIRKPMAPPTVRERDRREDLKREDARKDMEEHEGTRGQGKAGSDDP